MIEDWFRGILTDGILSNLSGLFDSVNTEVGEIATQVGTTPAGWNAGIFNMIRSLSENVIVPIAGVIITFVMCYELIQLVIEKNNLHDLDTWIFFKWIFKTFVAVLLVTNTWNIVMGVFDITQSVVNDSAGVIISDTSIDIATVITDIEAKLDAMSVGGLLGLWFQSLFVGLTMKALSICIMLVETRGTTGEETISYWFELPIDVAEFEEKLGVGAESGEYRIIEKVLPYADEVQEHTSVYQLNELDFMYRQLSSDMQEEYVSLLSVYENLEALYICRNVITGVVS